MAFSAEPTTVCAMVASPISLPAVPPAAAFPGAPTGEGGVALPLAVSPAPAAAASPPPAAGWAAGAAGAAAAVGSVAGARTSITRRVPPEAPGGTVTCKDGAVDSKIHAQCSRLHAGLLGWVRYNSDT